MLAVCVEMENIPIKKEPMEVKPEFVDPLNNVKIVYRSAPDDYDESDGEIPSINAPIDDKRSIRLVDVKPNIEQLPSILDSTFLIERNEEVTSSIEEVNQEKATTKNREAEPKVGRKTNRRSDAHTMPQNRKRFTSQKRLLKRIYREEEISYFYPAPKKSRREPAEQYCETKTRYYCDACDETFKTLKMLLTHRRLHVLTEWQSITTSGHLFQLLTKSE